MSMSAFVVEPATINKIISWLRHEFLQHAFLSWIADRFKIDTQESGWEQRLAEQMYSLNVAAVNQRYQENNATPAIVFSVYPYTSPVSAFKALGCFLYQCSEGEIPQTMLYQYFEELEKQTAILIVQNLPEYDQALWG